MAKTNYKKGVAKNLLDLCVGSNLEEQRIGEKVVSKCEEVVREKDGLEVEAEVWKNLHKKKLQR